MTNADDSGPGSLRQAILDANSNPGSDEISFNIAGSGVHTIRLASPLPAITEPVILNGYTQPGSSPNTNPVGQGLNTVLTISIDGSAAGLGSCITVNAGNLDFLGMEISGLNISGCNPVGIFAGTGADGLLISGNFIGTDPTGSVRAPGQDYAISIGNVPGVEIGGALPYSRNLLSGSRLDNVFAIGPNTVIRGNLIGTNAAGDAAIAPDLEFGRGIIVGGANAMIGGPDTEHRNVISGHGDYGIEMSQNPGPVTIEGNFIGTDVTGTRPLANKNGIIANNSVAVIRGNVIAASVLSGIVGGGPGLIIHGNFVGTDESATLDLGNGGMGIEPRDALTIGGIGPGEGNVIAYNGKSYGYSGVSTYASGVRIRGNRFFGNVPLGIDLLEQSIPDTGVTRNDPGDIDTGSNALQNFPLILSVTPGASTTHVAGILNSTATTSFDVDLYAVPLCQSPPQGYLQGDAFLGTLVVTTDGSGNASFGTDVPQVLAPGQRVTATATDPSGNTSEFSQGLLFAVDPESGPAGGGTETTLHGMLFEMGATVTVGGVPATNVLVQGSTSILATMPPLPAGSVNDVSVVNPSGTSGVVERAWIADFLDVPALDPFHTFVIELVSHGITAGVGGGNYGKTQPTLRQQMAVFLLKAKHGLCYTPPACTGVFSDVPCPSPFADWIEAFADEGITSGCGGGLYCPQTPVRRDQMAVFLLKAFYGSDHVPPPCTGVFDDVDCPSPFADWIEQLAAEQITSGCGGDNYCPFSPNTRGQMAVFIVKTFFQP